ncbi:winged helix-turn-helix domain-containing protein [Candidatus Palauibacter sp.]|uniref:winged helix-turn-helix domain-containing protein n=1 Tax=Candidatus Palauibacter sp. TaxID=3101350 RepID=UPI003C6F5CFE
MYREPVSWKESAIYALAEAGHPRHYRDIARRIDRMEIKPHRSDDAASTVSAAITTSLRTEGPASPFIRTEPGVYALRPDFDVLAFLEGRGFRADPSPSSAEPAAR